MTGQSKREQNRAERRSTILNAALKVFSEQGFTATTMDHVAQVAGLSKPTVYSYFDGKDALFRAMLLMPRDDMLIAFHSARAGNHVDQLWTFAWIYAETVLRPDLLSLARLIIAEAQRFPEIGRVYQASGPGKVLAGLIKFMEATRSTGALNFEDAELCAQDFWGLILSAPRNKALHDPDAIPTGEELARYIRNGMQVFLKAYSTQPDQDLAHLAQLKDEPCNS